MLMNANYVIISDYVYELQLWRGTALACAASQLHRAGVAASKFFNSVHFTSSPSTFLNPAGVQLESNNSRDMALLEQTQFFKAAEKGDVKTMKSFLSKPHGSDALAFVGENGRTPLLAAARFGHVRVVTLLLDAGAEVDAQNDSGVTPIMVCSTALLQSCPTPKKLNATPVAAAAGHYECVQRLLGHGACISTVDDTGKSAMDWAREAGQQRVLELMEKHAAGEASVTVSPKGFFSSWLVSSTA
eukprot:6197884-Pleurochrysis_carterae.AAC.4